MGVHLYILTILRSISVKVGGIGENARIIRKIVLSQSFSVPTQVALHNEVHLQRRFDRPGSVCMNQDCWIQGDYSLLNNTVEARVR
jgi:hypothetical protein